MTVTVAMRAMMYSIDISEATGIPPAKLVSCELESRGAKPKENCMQNQSSPSVAPTNSKGMTKIAHPPIGSPRHTAVG